MSCPLCGRIWRIPGPIPQSHQAKANSGPQATPILHMCPNSWCSYYVQETPDKDIGKCRRLINKWVCDQGSPSRPQNLFPPVFTVRQSNDDFSHVKNCIENRKKNKVFHRISKKNGMQGGRFIPEDKKRKSENIGAKLRRFFRGISKTSRGRSNRYQKRAYGRFVVYESWFTVKNIHLPFSFARAFI